MFFNILNWFDNIKQNENSHPEKEFTLNSQDVHYDDDDFLSMYLSGYHEDENSLIVENNVVDENGKVIIPTKYKRSFYSDHVIQFLTYITLIIDFAIVIVINLTMQWNFYRTPQKLAFLIITEFFSILIICWLHYKINHVVCGFYKICMNFSIFKTNNKYYSGLEIPDNLVLGKVFPDITIQIPLYKEDLENTITPTILSALEQSNRYNLETGKKCNIIVCDDGLALLTDNEKQERITFYKKYGIGYTARPHPSKLTRVGRFKKAGNLNFSMNFSSFFMNDFDLSNPMNELLYLEYKRVLDLGAAFYGDIKYGAYVFLIDSDTRMPNFSPEKNGSLKRMVKEFLFDGKNVLYMQCYTAPYISTKTLAEKSIFHSTCNTYNSILIGTSMHQIPPLVGHNVFLNFDKLKEISSINIETNYHYYWNENRISEDFDLMMRGCEQKLNGRYISHAGVFLEGISFSFMTEYFKISKFACGAAELTFNPISQWIEKGILSSNILGFLFCKEVEWYNKIFISSYILNFIAVAQAHVSLFLNLFYFDDLFDILPYTILPINLAWESIILWGVFNLIANLIFAKRVNLDIFTILRQQTRDFLLSSALYGSSSVRFSILYISHLFNLQVQFGATQKNEEQITILDWIKNTKYECAIYTFYLFAIFIRTFVFTIKSYFHTFYFGCLPLFMLVFWYWAGPLIFDILPKNVNKKQTESYIPSKKMFIDKYNTIIPDTEYFAKI
jgi:hypothetical protein